MLAFHSVPPVFTTNPTLPPAHAFPGTKVNSSLFIFLLNLPALQTKRSGSQPWCSPAEKPHGTDSPRRIPLYTYSSPIHAVIIQSPRTEATMALVSDSNQRISDQDALAGLAGGLPGTCVFLGLVVVLGLGVYTRRRSAAKKTSSTLPLSNPKAQEAGLEIAPPYSPLRHSSPGLVPEKQQNEQSSISETPASPAPLPLPQQQTLPAAFATAQRPLPPYPPPFTPPMLDLSASSNNPSPSDYSLPEVSFSSSTFEASELPPRRRSYTKMTTEGTEFSGEIVAAEGWRRHTRVFGGGVCQACLESEKRMSQ